MAALVKQPGEKGSARLIRRVFRCLIKSFLLTSNVQRFQRACLLNANARIVPVPLAVHSLAFVGIKEIACVAFFSRGHGDADMGKKEIKQKVVGPQLLMPVCLTIS